MVAVSLKKKKRKRKEKEKEREIDRESIVKQNQSKYYEALEESGSTGESTPFVEFMLEILKESLTDYIQQSNKLGDRLGDKLGDAYYKLSKNRKMILNSIHQNSKITISELSKLLSISTTAVENNLKYLKENNLLKRVGSDNSGSWEINF